MCLCTYIWIHIFFDVHWTECSSELHIYIKAHLLQCGEKRIVHSAQRHVIVVGFLGACIASLQQVFSQRPPERIVIEHENSGGGSGGHTIIE